MRLKLIIGISIFILHASLAIAGDHPSWRDSDYFDNVEIQCQSDATNDWTPEEQHYIDTLWEETLLYLDSYLKSITSATGKCRDSAEAIIQTYNPETGKKESRCIMKYRTMQLLAKHVLAILENPDKAKQCFAPERTAEGQFTPSEALYSLSPVAKWMQRPLLTDYYRKIGGEMGRRGIEFAESFHKIAAKTNSKTHFNRDITINGLPNLWASVGWVPMYSVKEMWTAGTPRFRSGYAYGEVMGPWGLLRIKSINGESVGAEIGMTVQVFDTTYPYHFHDSQEIYQTLTVPQCADQNQSYLMFWDNPALTLVKETDTHYYVEVDGARDDRWKKWFMNSDPDKDWLLYLERNAIHAFNTKAGCNAGLEDSGFVTVWARPTSRDANYLKGVTSICRLKDQALPIEDVNDPAAAVICKCRKWQY